MLRRTLLLAGVGVLLGLNVRALRASSTDVPEVRQGVWTVCMYQYGWPFGECVDWIHEGCIIDIQCIQ